MTWLQVLPKLPVIPGLQMVLDPKDESGRWPHRSPRGVVQLDEDANDEPYFIARYRNGGEQLSSIKLLPESRLDLGHLPTFLYALHLLSKLSDTKDAWLQIEDTVLGLSQSAVVEWEDITDDDRLFVASTLRLYS